MIIVAEIILGALLFMMGASIFSFLNVVIYRMPKKMSFVKGRSICPACNTSLKPLDLIPVFSFLGLRGKCRYCKAKIPVKDTIFEVAGGILALVCAHQFENQLLLAVFIFAVLSILYVIAGIDAATMEIPDQLVLFLLAAAVIGIFIFPEVSLLEHVIGAFAVSVPMLLIAIAIPGGFGGGDIKMMFVAGLLLGWRLTVFSFFTAVIFGGIYGIYLLAAKKKGRKDHFAFGPFLCVGIMIAIFLGNQIISWYLGFFPQY